MSPMTGGKFIFKPRTTTMNIPVQAHQAVATQGPKDFNLTTFLENLNMIQYYDTVSQNNLNRSRAPGFDWPAMNLVHFSLEQLVKCHAAPMSKRKEANDE